MHSWLACVAVLALAVVAEARQLRDPYHVYSLENACPPSGMKREIQLRTGAAIFILNELAGKDTRKLLEESDFSCHLEVEAPSGYGFHVFMEELSLDKGTGQGCDDYIQFGRDVLYITTSKSAQFCGHRSPMNYHNATAQSVRPGAKTLAEGQRWYVEERDNEMDIWIRIKKNAPVGQRGQGPTRPAWRKIVLVVTVFKDSCGSKDLFYRQCKHSTHCIRKDFFCDYRANCAWPNGEEATDEKDCEGYLEGTYAMKSAFLKPSSIPVFLIIAIIISVGMAGVMIAIKRLVRGVQNSEAYSEVRTMAVPVNAVGSAQVRDEGGPSNPEATAPPPSYDDVITEEARLAEDKPPPYSEQTK